MTEAATPLPRKTIAVVADYGRDDLAFYEVKQKLLALYPNADIALVSVAAFDTRETAYAVREAAVAEGVDFVYHNTAPRFDDKKPRGANHGEGLAYARIRRADGHAVDIIGVNAGDGETGNTFSVLVHRPGSDYTLEGPVRQIDWRRRVGSQFRSLHEFPYEVEAQLKGLPLTFTGEADVPPPVTDGDARARAAAAVQAALARDYRVAGDARQGYVTLLAPRADAARWLRQLAPRFAGLEVDILPLEGSWEADPAASPARAEDYAIRAAFIAAQLALTAESPEAAQRRTIIALPEGGADDAEALYEARLTNGARVIASTPRALSFVRSHIAEVHAHGREGRSLGAGGADGGGWLTSAASSARRFAALADTRKEALQQGGLHVPPIEGLFVVYADGYGNLKLSLPKQTVLELIQQQVRDSSPSGLGIPAHDAHVPRVRVALRGRDGKTHTLEAFIADTSFGVPNGETAFSAGSSGRWDGGRGLAEIFLRGGSAAKALGYPRSGEPVALEYLGLTYLPPNPTVAGNGREVWGGLPYENYAGAGI